eukprot:scaffold42339_cov14-Tisochrysis_lutea.AAC.1
MKQGSFRLDEGANLFASDAVSTLRKRAGEGPMFQHWKWAKGFGSTQGRFEWQLFSKALGEGLMSWN